MSILIIVLVIWWVVLMGVSLAIIYLDIKDFLEAKKKGKK